MKKGVGIVIGIIFGINIVLVVFIFLLLTGVVDVSIAQKGNKNDEAINNNVDNSDNKDKLLNVSYEDDVYEKEINNNTLRNVRNLPVITSNDNQASANKIVKYLTNISNKDWEQANKDDYLFNSFVKDGIIGVTYLFSTVVNNENLLSIDYKLNGSMGGVSWSGYWGYNFNPNTGDILKINDVLVDGGFAKLSDYVLIDIENRYTEEGSLWQQDNSTGYWKDIAKDNMFNLGNWIITDKGIIVTFGKYLLGPGSTGYIAVEIPKDIANSYLKDEYKIK